MAFKEKLTEKAGPLPVWAWSLIIGGVIVTYIYIRNKNAAATAAASAASTDTSTTPNAQDYAAGEIGAAYDVYNELGKLNATNATLATNVGSNTTALSQLPQKIAPVIEQGTAQGTQAGINAGKPYTVVDYGGEVFELGAHGGARLDTSQYQKTGVQTSYTGSPLVQFLGQYYTLGLTGDPGARPRPDGPAPITAAQIHGRKVTVLSPTTAVNVAPSKVK